MKSPKRLSESDEIKWGKTETLHELGEYKPLLPHTWTCPRFEDRTLTLTPPLNPTSNWRQLLFLCMTRNLAPGLTTANPGVWTSASASGLVFSHCACLFDPILSYFIAFRAAELAVMERAWLTGIWKDCTVKIWSKRHGRHVSVEQLLYGCFKLWCQSSMAYHDTDCTCT